MMIPNFVFPAWTAPHTCRLISPASYITFPLGYVIVISNIRCLKTKPDLSNTSLPFPLYFSTSEEGNFLPVAQAKNFMSPLTPFLCRLISNPLANTVGYTFKMSLGTCGQDGRIGRYTLPARTTVRRTTTNLKTKNKHNWQKIELYRSPTTKELKKKQSSRLLEGQRWAPGAVRTHSKAVVGGLECGRWQLVDQWSHICMGINWE